MDGPLAAALVTGTAVIVAALITALAQRLRQQRDATVTQPIELHVIELPRDHFYTTSAAERDRAVTQFGYRSEGTAAYVLRTEQPGSVPLFRLCHDARIHHLYTADDTERDSAVAQLGYRDEGREGYVFKVQVSGVLPLFRIVHSVTKHTLYTTSTLERDDFIQHRGYSKDGVVCYVFEDPGENRVPLFRLLRVA